MADCAEVESDTRRWPIVELCHSLDTQQRCYFERYARCCCERACSSHFAPRPAPTPPRRCCHPAHPDLTTWPDPGKSVMQVSMRVLSLRDGTKCVR